MCTGLLKPGEQGADGDSAICYGMLGYRILGLGRVMLAVVAASSDKLIPATRSKRFPASVIRVVTILGASASNSLTICGYGTATYLTLRACGEHALICVFNRCHIIFLIHILTISKRLKRFR